MMKKSLAFTLGEVLIALGVIGVVASLVIPLLVNGQKAGTARAQFDTAYSLLSKTIADMDADNVPVLPANYTANSLYSQVKKYSRVATDCGTYSSDKNTSVCIGYGGKDSSGNTDNYKIYNKQSNTKINLSRVDDGGFVLTNGMMVAFEQPAYSTRTINGKVYARPILITIDINGKGKNPNRWGWDLFTFELTNQGIQPVGSEFTHPDFSTNPAALCSKTGTGTENGITCAYYAATDADYFTKLYSGH